MRERDIEPPKTEDQLRYEGLPIKVILYLDVAKSARNPLIGDDSRSALRIRQVEVLQAFQPEEMQSLVDYLTWRQERIKPDLGITNRGNIPYRGPITDGEPT